jgi:hypothetical protein
LYGAASPERKVFFSQGGDDVGQRLQRPDDLIVEDGFEDEEEEYEGRSERPLGVARPVLLKRKSQGEEQPGCGEEEREPPNPFLVNPPPSPLARSWRCR